MPAPFRCPLLHSSRGITFHWIRHPHREFNNTISAFPVMKSFFTVFILCCMGTFFLTCNAEGMLTGAEVRQTVASAPDQASTEKASTIIIKIMRLAPRAGRVDPATARKVCKLLVDTADAIDLIIETDRCPIIMQRTLRCIIIIIRWMDKRFRVRPR